MLCYGYLCTYTMISSQQISLHTLTNWVFYWLWLSFLQLHVFKTNTLFRRCTDKPTSTITFGFLNGFHSLAWGHPVSGVPIYYYSTSISIFITISPPPLVLNSWFYFKIVEPSFTTSSLLPCWTGIKWHHHKRISHSQIAFLPFLFRM